MALDNKVAKISPKENTKERCAKKFDYWIMLSTLGLRKTIDLPLVSNKYFDEKKGKQKKFCQINIDQQERITICLIKDVEKKTYVPQIPKIALDFGLRTLFTSNQGDLYGRDFIEMLKKYDLYINSLTQNRQRQKLTVKSHTYNRLVSNLRSFLKNEINRVINQIVKNYQPGEIVVEDLNFTSPQLSRRLNRILSNAGRRIVKKKFDSITEEFGIVITLVPAPYTSQECNFCGYVDKNNRKSQSVFVCRNCNHKLHADVNGARNILMRSSDKDLSNIYLCKSAILDILLRRFLENCSNLYHYFPDFGKTNPYFKNTRQYGTNGNLKYG